MTQGKIKTLNDKGFGFIAIEGQKKDLFFHSSELVNVHFDDLKTGDLVEFELGDGPKGPCAKGVSLVN